MKHLHKILPTIILAYICLAGVSSHMPWLKNIGTQRVAYGTRLVFPNATITAGGDSISVDAASNKLTKGGDTDGAALTYGTNDAFGSNWETQNINRLRLDANGRFFSGTLTDFSLTASDSFAAYSAGPDLLLASNNARLVTSGGNIGYQLTNSSTSHYFTCGDNVSQVMVMSILGAENPFFSFNSTDNAEATSIGTALAGSTVQFNGVQVAGWSTYTATSTLNSSTSYHDVDVSAGGQTFTFPTGQVGGSLFYISNSDGLLSITIAAPGGETIDGSTTVMPNATATFQKRGTIWRRLF